MNYTAEQIMDLVETLTENTQGVANLMQAQYAKEKLRVIANNYESMSKRLKELEGMEVHFPYCDKSGL